ncbi:MAG TPA: hypothetical protein PKO36_06490 [Candidatus Hydrogenedentes bacterium]|nr:hypothetical protein [Candidatus Hydrogenedentota bacterium]HRT22263.1 hypothetical protein [Candidatus Hydrogenedentota bacterium]
MPRNEAGIAAYAEDNFKKEIAPGVLERAQANGVDLIEQCIAESPEFRAWDDKLTYRDNSGRVTAHLVCCYDMAEPDAYGTPT